MGKALNPHYKTYHPRWYRPRMPIFWWLRTLPYVKFIARELTSFAVAYAAILLAIQARALGQGEEAYGRFSSWLQSSPVVWFHIVVLLVVLFHTVTWLNLAPKALVAHVKGRRVPDVVVLLSHYAAWLVVSGLLAWRLLG